MPTESITLRLMMLIGATTIPLSMLSVGMLYSDYRDDRQDAEHQLLAQARTVAEFVDREFERAQTLGRVLAGSSALASGDFDSFRQEMMHATQTYQIGLRPGAQTVMLGLANRSGHWAINTAQLKLTEQQQRPAPEHARRAVASGQAQISDLYSGTLTGQPRVGIAVPVFTRPAADEAPRAVGAIVIGISRDRFREMVEEAHLPPGAVASIHDRRGITVARSLRDAETAGKLPSPALLAVLTSGEAGLAPRGTKSAEGVASTIAFVHAPNSGYIVKINVPETVFLASLRASLGRTVGVGLIVLLFGLGLAALIGRGLVISLRRVVPAAQAAAQSGIAPGQLGLREADTMAAALTRVLIEQRTTTAALAASESKFRTLADALPQLVWSARANGEHDYFNARCYEFAGATVLDATSWSRLVHQDDRIAFLLRWQRAIARGEPFELECRAVRYDGEARWLLVRAIPICDDGPERTVMRWFGSCTDITDLVEARHVAARGRAELEAKIEERTRDLTEMQAQLAHAARMEALGQLAGGIAHDFNNVLQAVLGGSALIERRYNDPALVIKHARLIFDSAERGATITRRLLAFSHRSALRAGDIDTIGLLHDIQSILSHTLGAGVRTEITTPLELPPMLADKGQLETVLVNLATNARDAMSGSGTIVLSATNEIVAETGRGHPAGLRPGNYICIAVSDTGIGMDAATLERVIEPFFTTKSVGQGTGLGLAMAHGFAGQSGGGLHIESVLGEGTTVRLWLPVSESPQTVAPEAPPHSLATHSPALLLLVDDEALVRDVVKATLEIEGYQVLVAACADQALEVLKTASIDLLISDLSMPGMDGITLIRTAQRHQPDLPAILVTGFARDDTELAMSSAVSGSFAVLRKPVTSAQLCGRVVSLLQPEAA